jgi:hypothetical protein
MTSISTTITSVPAATATDEPTVAEDHADEGLGETWFSHDRTPSGSIIRRSFHAMTDFLSPFSPSALASLPPKPRREARYTRADAIPDDAQAGDDGSMPAVRDYHAINSLPPQVRVPKKIASTIKVEAKVWFANERSKFSRALLFLLHHADFIRGSLDILPQHLRLDRCHGIGFIQRLKG